MTGIALFASFLAVLQYAQAPPEVAGHGFGTSVLEASVIHLLPAGCSRPSSPRSRGRQHAGRPLIAAPLDPGAGLPRDVAFTWVALIGVVASAAVVAVAAVGIR
jgi:hypothetical protein